MKNFVTVESQVKTSKRVPSLLKGEGVFFKAYVYER